MHPVPQTVRPQPAHEWFAVDFDGQPARVIALSLFAAQAALLALGWAVDRAIGSDLAGFSTTMLLYAALVYLDARSVRYPAKRAAVWAAVAMFGLIVGAYAYARRRQHLRRAPA
jgi:hypothetical protein